MSEPSIFDELEKASERVQVTSAPSDQDASRIAELGREMAKLEEWLDNAAELVKQRTARLETIRMKELPDAMDSVNMDKMGLPEHNCDIVVSEYYKAGLPKPDPKDDPEIFQQKLRLRQEGLAWLGENAEGLINTTVEVTMPKGSLPLARTIRDTIIALFGESATPESRAEHLQKLDEWIRGRNDVVQVQASSVSVEEGVHWATLTSFVREQCKGGNTEIPLPALGATVGRIAKLVKRKANKK